MAQTRSLLREHAANLTHEGERGHRAPDEGGKPDESCLKCVLENAAFELELNEQLLRMRRAQPHEPGNTPAPLEATVERVARAEFDRTHGPGAVVRWETSPAWALQPFLDGVRRVLVTAAAP